MAKTTSVDKPLIERSKIMSISLKESEADEIKILGGNSLTKGIREAAELAKLVQELGQGDLTKGKRRLIGIIDKINSKN